MKKIYKILICFTVLFMANECFARMESYPISTDNRIRTIAYSQHDVFVFTGHYGYQSTIEFSQGEEVLTISAGDSISWQIQPSGHRIFLKPVEKNATTNMTVITTKRTYLFELHAKEAKSIRDKDLVFVLRFKYPENARNNGLAYNSTYIPAPDFEENMHKYNFNYKLTGPDTVSPVKIFDDGEFTFFEFQDKNAEVPAFFHVNSDASEELINYRVKGNYIVVERVSSRFTLRRGSDVVCVYNERRPFRKKEKKWYQSGK